MTEDQQPTGENAGDPTPKKKKIVEKKIIKKVVRKKVASDATAAELTPVTPEAAEQVEAPVEAEEHETPNMNAPEDHPFAEDETEGMLSSDEEAQLLSEATGTFDAIQADGETEEEESTENPAFAENPQPAATAEAPETDAPDPADAFEDDQSTGDGKRKKKSKVLAFFITLLWLIFSFGSVWGYVYYAQESPSLPFEVPFVNHSVILFAITIIFALLMLIRLRILMFLLFVIASPYTAAFGLGGFDYWQGEAQMRTMDKEAQLQMLGAESNSRAFWGTDDILWPKNLQLATYWPYNKGVEAMGLIMGPMDGQYTGYIPSQAEVENLHSDMKITISRSGLSSNMIIVDGEQFKLSQDVGKLILTAADASLNAYFEAKPPADTPEGETYTTSATAIRAHIVTSPQVGDRTVDKGLLVALSEPLVKDKRQPIYLALLDYSRGTLIATYEMDFIEYKDIIEKKQDTAKKNANKKKNGEGNDTGEDENPEVTIKKADPNKTYSIPKPSGWDRLKKGMSAAQVKRAIGEAPASESDDHIEYSDTNMFGKVSNRAWVVYFKNGRVSGLRPPKE